MIPAPFNSPAGPGENPAPVRLEFLDGLRGLAALYVALHHAFLLLVDLRIGQGGGLAGWWMTALRPLAYGRYAVDLFIVLSGYCLMLPVVRAGGTLRGGFGTYLRRRARRILPPYYAALVFSLLVIGVLRGWMPANGITAGVLGPGDVVTHFLLVHNLVNVWSHSINAPLWSVATEWQIYFLFPGLLLPVWRRLGGVAAAAAAFVVGYGADALTPPVGLGGAAPWLAGLFALGMLAAIVNFSPRPDARRLRAVVPWGAACLALTVALAVVGGLAGGWFKTHAKLIDPIFGLAAMCLLVFCADRARRPGPGSWGLALLQSRPAAVLGAFSYSLYLIHRPLLDLVASLLLPLGLPPAALVPALFGVYLPAALGIAYGFHLLFERPFMPGKPSTIRGAVLAAEVSPAP